MNVVEAKEKGLLPLEVYDANGTTIDLPITDFNEETGDVTFVVMTASGQPLVHNDCVWHANTRFAAPLTWESVARDDG